MCPAKLRLVTSRHPDGRSLLLTLTLTLALTLHPNHNPGPNLVLTLTLNPKRNPNPDPNLVLGHILCPRHRRPGRIVRPREATLGLLDQDVSGVLIDDIDVFALELAVRVMVRVRV